ncbi:5-oxoprolinase subunit PxpB [Ralstonia holmesii]|uniref:5-oxoprolinase subunit B n=1 Tax=Ralstonia holmesii TaxID=3058602 RepID=A0ABC8QED1_9RALS|nr:5-oxoprolinase subunit PxpB [Ralstonia sp. LMG 32967]CAJ0796864.1 5-oxoprolinase subunit B [Ralstonia sp. LMG 32967]CAJ0805915.1 5-oxoprolinase subunit B [Ralstonia sp. LMG 32967]
MTGVLARENAQDRVPAGTLASERTAGSPVPVAAVRVHLAGSGAILFDPSTGAFDAAIQQRLIALVHRMRAELGDDETCELVPGVNNLLFIFNPLVLHPTEAEQWVRQLWETIEPLASTGREIEIPVVYGGVVGEDLVSLASGASLSVEEYVDRHSSALYTVACVGSMPGFAYMTGLPPELAIPRRKVPRMKVTAGTVIVGGSQAGVMPCIAPSGWHLIGTTNIEMFNPFRQPACLLLPGDRVRFVAKGIEP